MAKYGGEEYKDIYGIREIRFRGRVVNMCKELSTDLYTIAEAWVYGDLIQDGEKYYIKDRHSMNLIPVPKETICEYTGVNGCHSKLYENDILKRGKNLYVVTWKEGAFGLENVKTGRFKPFYQITTITYWEDNYEHIGNTIDNPNLINKDICEQSNSEQR